MFASSDAGREMVTQLSARQSKRLCRHQHGRSESTATDLLAVTAMAFQHHDRLGRAFVANCATDAAAGERYFHSRVIWLLGLEPWFSEQSLSLMFGFRYFAFVSGSMIPNTFPAGSAAYANQPTFGIAIFGTQILPPRSSTFLIV